MSNLLTFEPNSHQQRILRTLFAGYLGQLHEDQLCKLLAQCQWLLCEGGGVLFNKHDPGNAAFFLVSGRLRAVDIDSRGKRILIGDIAPGESVGELAVLGGATRRSTVVAARDSVLVRVDAVHLQQWFIDYPQLLLKLAKLMIARDGAERRNNRRENHVTNIVIMPVTPQVDAVDFEARMRLAIAPYGKALVLDAAEAARRSGEHRPGDTQQDDGRAYERLNDWLEEQESRHDFVIFVASAQNDPWSLLCLRRADRLVLLADARDASKPSNFEQTVIQRTSTRLIADTFLLLKHPADARHPSGTSAWLDARPWVSEAIHFRDGDAAHMSRLARLMTGNAIGLVMGSGGVRGMSEVGVFRALCEAGIPIDRVGGTSIGAVVAACVASGWDAAQVDRHIRSSFSQSPTGLRDMSFPPLISIYSGKRLRQLLDEFFAPPMAIEDLWINYFCVSCDISDNTQAVHYRGTLRRAICASVSLPGVFPPVKIGSGLHVDGAFMNALPVDIMGNLGVKRVIAVDLGFQPKKSYTFTETPPSLDILLNKLFRRRPGSDGVPTITSTIIQSSLLASAAKTALSRLEADLLFTPDVRKYDLLNWSACGDLIQLGYAHARQVLDSHSETRWLSQCAAQLPLPAPPDTPVQSSS
jgi:NTE family protein